MNLLQPYKQKKFTFDNVVCKIESTNPKMNKSNQIKEKLFTFDQKGKLQ